MNPGLGVFLDRQGVVWEIPNPWLGVHSCGSRALQRHSDTAKIPHLPYQNKHEGDTHNNIGHVVLRDAKWSSPFTVQFSLLFALLCCERREELITLIVTQSLAIFHHMHLPVLFILHHLSWQSTYAQNAVGRKTN
jgi:hypothetical protein